MTTKNIVHFLCNSGVCLEFKNSSRPKTVSIHIQLPPDFTFFTYCLSDTPSVVFYEKPPSEDVQTSRDTRLWYSDCGMWTKHCTQRHTSLALPRLALCYKLLISVAPKHLKAIVVFGLVDSPESKKYTHKIVQV